MIIQNFTKLADSTNKQKALAILEAGLFAAMPEQKLSKILKKNQIQIGKKTIRLSQYDDIYLIAFGKAADSMAMTVDSKIKIKKGIIVIPKGSKPIIRNKKFQIFKSSHPLPSNTSIRAAKSILQFLKKRKKLLSVRKSRKMSSALTGRTWSGRYLKETGWSITRTLKIHLRKDM